MATTQRNMRTADGPSRVPPHNLEAEESVLGACLLSREAIASALEILSAEDFYKPAHAEIFNSILQLYGKGEPVDAITLSEELARRGSLDQIGDKPYIHTLLQTVPTPGSATHYARIVEEHALLRRLISASHEISDMAFSMPEEVEETIDQAEDLIYQVSRRRVSADFVALKDLLTENMEMVEKLYERGSSITGLPTGFTELDEITAGLQNSNLIIVAARPAMGKSSWALTVAQHLAVNEQVPCVIFSLEMSKMELVQRMMCAEARVDSSRLRRGNLKDSDWPALSHALGRLAEAPVFIDDTPNVTVMEMRAKCRRLKSKHGLGLVIVDYLQLMQSLKRSENRVQEVSEISRSLKILARELDIPVIAVSQLSRNVEYRSDKRPLLADLRESGCLAGETLVTLSTGESIPIEKLVGKQPNVLSAAGLKLTSGRAVKVWKTGRKPVFKLTTTTGRQIRATGNHPFLQLQGWKPLEDLRPGDRIAVARGFPEPPSASEWDPRRIVLLAHLIGDGSVLKGLPVRYASLSKSNLQAVTEAAGIFGIQARTIFEPSARSYQLFLPSPRHCTHGVRNPITAWFDELGLFDKRSHEKFVPQEIFGLANKQIALFLKHLWATDGCVWLGKGTSGKFKTSIYYSTSSPVLASQVQHLLARLGIVGRLRTVKKGNYRENFHVQISGKTDQLLFAEIVGGFGEREEQLRVLTEYLNGITANTNVDTLPIEVWQRVRSRMKEVGITHRQMAQMRGVTYGGTSQYQYAPSRGLLAQYCEVLEDEELSAFATSDMYWDTIKSIEADGIEDVYDMTVPGSHNFVANGLVVHNSIEQDSDLVLFIYRDEVYNPDTPQKGIAEIHIAKHRNGPIGKVDLAFLDHYTKFANLARGV